MKKITMCALALLMVSSLAFSADFSPTLLRLSAPEAVKYSFDGSDMELSVTVSGTAANVVFFVYTKGMADKILDVNNGFLGWHYVHKIDTCMYVSSPQSMPQGDNTITWDGKDADGGLVPAGDYTYYLWAYDNISTKQEAMFGEGSFVPSSGVNTEEFGEDGQILEKPIFYNRSKKWAIGNDPFDMTLLETTSYPLGEGWRIVKSIAFDPTDHGYVYTWIDHKDTNTQRIQKFQWVPNGEAVLDTEWGEELVFSNHHYAGGGPVTDRETIWASYYSQYEYGDNTNFYVVDFDGTLLTEFDNSKWFSKPEDYAAGAQYASGPSDIAVRHKYAFVQHAHACVKGMVNPYAEDEDDYFVWINQNGDYVDDFNFAETANLPWVCVDFNVGPYSYSIAADDNLFSVTSSYDMGAVSFSLKGPDGTGVAYFAYAGETANVKYGTEIIDSGCAYDGFYTDNHSSDEQGGLWFIGHDSISGTITSAVGVADEPAAFSVAQNTPNPFNPTTTISFSLAEAGTVTIDVFNVAGQKVDTITDGFMDAGNHSVVWNASNFSAGVYFYTVKAGDYSRTMKMTLVK